MNVSARDIAGPIALGIDAPHALSILLSSLPDVEEVYLAELRPLPPLQTRRSLTPAEQMVVGRALKSRESTGLAFWDAVLLELSRVPDAIGLLDEAMMHVTFRGNERRVSRSAVISGEMERMCAAFSSTSEASLVLISEMRRHDGSKSHLPMVDFHTAASDLNKPLVIDVVERLFPGGAVLLDSGESYHAYGLGLLSEPEFVSFLGEALLFAPIVDRTYLAHQLIERRCSLRLTAGGGKSRVPRVVSVIQGR
jgi:hypothetical protein